MTEEHVEENTRERDWNVEDDLVRKRKESSSSCGTEGIVGRLTPAYPPTFV